MGRCIVELLAIERPGPRALTACHTSSKGGDMAQHPAPTVPTVGNYQRDGFEIHPSPVFPAALMDRVSAGIDAELSKLPAERLSTAELAGHTAKDIEVQTTGRLTTVSEGPPVTLAADGVPELLAHPALMECARQVTGLVDTRVWWVQYFGKQPDGVEGGYTGWHQDWTSWSAEANSAEGAPNGWGGEGLFTCWVALADVDQAAGPLRFVRGSHRWGVKYPDKGTHRQDPAGQQREIEALRDGAAEAAEAAAAGADVDEPPLYSWEVVSSILPKGAVSFHDWRTVHGSDPNHSQNQRRGLAIHMCSAETVNEGGPLTAHLLDPRANPPPRATAGASRL